MTNERWFAETLTPGVRLSLQARKLLCSERTQTQELALFDHVLFGRVLLLDGALQLTSADEFVYHEMMAHVPLLAHGAARDILIVGGGDCGLAEEVLKHAGVRNLAQVEIDARIVELAREHLGAVNAPVFDDPRFALTIADGREFLDTTEQRFDVVLVDSTDPVGPGRVLFTEDFYRAVHRRLNPGGILVTQNGVPFVQANEFSAAMANLAAVYRHVCCYTVSVPTYFGGALALGWSSDADAALTVPRAELAARFERANLATRYYSPAVHKAAFALPRYIEDALRQAVGET